MSADANQPRAIPKSRTNAVLAQEIPQIIRAPDLQLPASGAAAGKEQFRAEPRVCEKPAEQALQESEKRLHLALKAARMSVWTWDIAAQRISVSNPDAPQLPGLRNVSSFTYRQLLEAIVPEDRQRLEEAVRKALDGKGSYKIQFRVRWTDGTTSWLESHAEPFFDASGRVVQMIGATVDITELKRTEQRQNVLAALGRKLSSARTLNEAAQITAEAADTLFGFRCFTLNLYSIENDEVTPILNFDEVNGRREEVTWTWGKIPSARMRRILKHGAELVLRQPPLKMGADSFPIGDSSRPSASIMSVPIRHGEKAVGILSVQSYLVGAYTSEDLHVLQTLADHCGGAFDRIWAEEALRENQVQKQRALSQANARLQREIAARKQLARRNLVLARLGQSLSSARTARQAARTIARAAQQLFDLDAYSLDLCSTVPGELLRVFYLDTIDDKRVEIPTGKLGVRLTDRGQKVLKHGPQLILKDQPLKMLPDATAFGAVSRPSASIMLAPIRTRKRAIGLISVHSYQLGAYRSEDLQMLQSLADHCSSALERIRAEERLHRSEAQQRATLLEANERLQREVSERTRMQQHTKLFSTLGYRLSLATTPTEAARIISRAADKLIGWDSCFLELYRPEGKYMERVLNVDVLGGRRCETEPGTQVSRLSPLAGRVLKHGPHLLLRRRIPRKASCTIPFGNTKRLSASLMFVPLRDGTRVTGLFSIQSYTRNAYTRKDLDLLQALADHCGGALKKLLAERALRESEKQKRILLSKNNAELQRQVQERQRLEKEILVSTERERRRIGQDLHDDLGQQLTGVSLLARGLELKLGAVAPQHSREAGKIRRLVSQTIRRARQLARGLSSIDFDERDLGATLQKLAQHVERVFEISCRFTSSGEIPKVNANTVRELSRIAQEALTNAVKHGQARQISIELAAEDSELVLTVRNDGRPFRAGASPNGGMGLRIMQYRARLIGASLDIKPNRKHGSILTCALPLRTAGGTERG